MHEIIDKKFYLGPKFGTLINKKWITISELLQVRHSYLSEVLRYTPYTCGSSVPARENPARFTIVPIGDIHIFIGEIDPTPAMVTDFWRIGMAKTPKRSAFELDTKEESSDLELSKLSRSDLKTNPTQPALDVEEVVDDRYESAMNNLVLETLR
jgi:hypothetical protein